MPQSITAEAGQLSVDNNEKLDAVILTFISEVGPVQAIIPSEAVEGIANNMLDAKKKAEEESSGIYVPRGGMDEAKAVAKASEELEKVSGIKK